MRRWLGLLLALVPVMLGLLVALSIRIGIVPGSTFFAQVQIAADDLALLGGLALGVVALAVALIAERYYSVVRRVALEVRLAQEEAHRRFIRRLDHELKNPLTAIRAGLANLDDGLGNENAAKASLCSVRQQADRLSRLVGDLRKLADLDVGSLEHESIDLAEVIAEATEMARSAPSHGARTVGILVQKLPWPMGPVRGDRDLLLLAIYNLLDNALKFSGPDALVEVRAGENGTHASVEVVDTGQGITEADLPHITEELYRGEGARGIDGSGLGLALVRRAVELHGGTLALRSRQGQGTVATLQLPIDRP